MAADTASLTGRFRSHPWVLISVIGGGEAAATEKALAEEVGRLLALRGVVVVCGGLGGVMEAACRGARSGGTITVGLLPGDDPTAANPYVDVSVPTGLGAARNALVVAAGLSVIAIGGAYGTLSEIGHALSAGKTVVGLDTWELPGRVDLEARLIPASSAAEAVELAVVAAESRLAGARAFDVCNVASYGDSNGQS